MKTHATILVENLKEVKKSIYDAFHRGNHLQFNRVVWKDKKGEGLCISYVTKEGFELLLVDGNREVEGFNSLS